MYTRDLWASLARRWPLVVLCLLGTAGLLYVVSLEVAPTYESRADVVLVPPRSVVDPTANRYLDLGGLRQAVDVLTRSLTSEETVDVIAELSPGGTFEAMSDGTTSAPIVVVTVTASTRGGAQRTLDAVLDRVPVNLGRLQKTLDISEKSLITSQVVSSDETPAVINKKRIRAVGAVGALALLASALLIAAVDNRLLRRRSERAPASAEVAPSRPPRPVADDQVVRESRPVMAAQDPKKHHAVAARARR